MSKIKIKIKIHNNLEDNTIESMAIIQENMLKYRETDGTIATYNFQKNNLVRENKEFRMSYHFSTKEETEGIWEWKEYSKKIIMKIQTKTIKRKKNDIKIHFMIEKNDFIYQIEELK